MAAPKGLHSNSGGVDACFSRRCSRSHRHAIRLVGGSGGGGGLLLVLREDLQSLADLGGQSLGGLEKVEQLSVVHLEEHA